MGGIVYTHRIYVTEAYPTASRGRMDVQPGSQLKALCVYRICLSVSVRTNGLCAGARARTCVTASASASQAGVREHKKYRQNVYARSLATWIVPEVAARYQQHQRQHQNWRGGGGGDGTDITVQRAHIHQHTRTQIYTQQSASAAVPAATASRV